jgi:hypothetical protein
MMAQFEKLVHMGDLKRFGVEIEGVWEPSGYLHPKSCEHGRPIGGGGSCCVVLKEFPSTA